MNKNLMKNIASFIVMIVIGILAVGSTDTDTKTQKVQSQPPSYTLSANQLYHEYESNEVNADAKYKGKVVIVTGTIQDIGKDIMDNAFIVIGGTGFLDGVQCIFAKEEQSAVGRLSKGQQVTVKGEVAGKMGNVLVNECSMDKKATQEVAKTAKGTSEVLKVKDLYLDMNIDEVPAILKQKLPDHEISDITNNDDGTYSVSLGSASSVTSDKTKKVIEIFFIGNEVNDIFNAADMNNEEFVQNFINAYGIPEMKPTSIRYKGALKYNGWEYTSSSGFKVFIGDEAVKLLIIQKVASEGERKFD